MSRLQCRLLAATRTPVSYSPPTHQYVRSFSQTCSKRDEPKRTPSLLSMLPRSIQSTQPRGPPRLGASGGGDMSALQRILAQDSIAKARNQPTSTEQILSNEDEKKEDWGPPNEPFHFHIYSHKHNCHITVTKPNRGAIISMSTGNLAFKKAKRGTYDAAYQLTAYVIDKLHQGNWHKNITAMEVVLRGFGQGREAATKVLLGTEGRMLRDKIVKVSDATRLKFGGTRSPKPRRLG
ncbi:translational machinery component [Daldinia caldariorum]|uniref:translational machinery component n=1 Tax=Daldinia caldariorum TaxID=326644 RepID=UPI002008BFCA|nr:translational machinery component [Daldinia caldariorum]KAI1467557.1 translational machinery component [Daldinia caldariorum]